MLELWGPGQVDLWGPGQGRRCHLRSSSLVVFLFFSFPPRPSIGPSIFLQMPCFILSPGFLLPRGHRYFLLLLVSGTQFHSPVCQSTITNGETCNKNSYQNSCFVFKLIWCINLTFLAIGKKWCFVFWRIRWQILAESFCTNRIKFPAGPSLSDMS